MKKELNWAVLGCGIIANEMAQALEHMGKHLYAVGNRTHEKAVTFAEKYGVQKVYDDFRKCSMIPTSMSFILPRRTIHISNLPARHLQAGSMCSVKNRSC